jgi:hypothetical protein
MRGWRGTIFGGGGGGWGMPPGGPMACLGGPAISGGGGGGGCAIGGVACMWNWAGIRGAGAIPKGKEMSITDTNHYYGDT